MVDTSIKDKIIGYANTFLAGRGHENPEGYRTYEQLDAKLGEVLSSLDIYWPHWVVGTELIPK